MTNENNSIAELGRRIDEYSDFSSSCISSLKSLVESIPYDEGKDRLVREKFNEGLVYYASVKFDEAAEIYSELIEHELHHLARPESKDMADRLFYLYKGKESFSERIQFRLNLIFKAHGISVYNQSQRIEIAQRLMASYNRS